jgi:CBS domain containing-hemolysin-like protein
MTGDTLLVLHVALFVLCLCFVGLAAAGQAAFAYVNAARLRHLMQQGATRTQALVEVLNRPGPFMTSVALLYLLAVAGSTIAAFSFARLFVADGAWQIVTVVVGLILVFLTQTLARTIAVLRPERVSVVLYRPLGAIGIITRPLVQPWYLLSDLIARRALGISDEARVSTTEEDLRVLVDAVEETEALEDDEREMIASIFEMSDRDVSEIMVPRVDMVTTEGTTRIVETVDLLVKTGHSRIPVYENDLDHVLGLVHLRDLAGAMLTGQDEAPVSSLVRPMHVVPETKKIDELLHEFQKQHIQMALVVDEYGGTEGVVTIEDLVEEIVGEIRDEYDVEEELIEKLSEREAIIDGRVSIHDANEALGIDLDDRDFDTIGGLVYGQLEKVPSPGDIVEIGDVTIRVLATKGRRIQRVHVAVHGESSAPRDSQRT